MTLNLMEYLAMIKIIIDLFAAVPTVAAHVQTFITTYEAATDLPGRLSAVLTLLKSVAQDIESVL